MERKGKKEEDSFSYLVGKETKIIKEKIKSKSKKLKKKTHSNVRPFSLRDSMRYKYKVTFSLDQKREKERKF